MREAALSNVQARRNHNSDSYTESDRQTVSEAATQVISKAVRESASMKLHSEAVAKARAYRRCEAELLDVLTRVEDRKLHLEFEMTSIFRYCVDLLDLPKHAAYDFITVMRCAAEIPELAEAIYSGKTSVSKARKISSVITSKNAKEWIDLTIHCSARVVEKAVAMANPRSAIVESLNYVSEDTLQLKLAVSEEWAALLASTKDRLSQAKRRAVSTEEALFILMSEAHAKADPVRRAERAQKRKTQKLAVLSPQQRKRAIPAAIRHAVVMRDQNQCVEIDSLGQRCENKRWIDIHHVTPFANGGAHTLENLETLCSAHHRLRHAH